MDAQWAGQYQGAKVSKSDPRMNDIDFANQFKALHLIEKYGADVIRFLILQGHYRRPIDFAPEHLGAVAKSLRRLQRQVSLALDKASIPVGLAEIEKIELSPSIADYREDFIRAMDDDFNTGIAVSVCFSLAGLLKKSEGEEKVRIAQLVAGLGALLGVDLTSIQNSHVVMNGGSEDTAAHHERDAMQATIAGLMDLIIELRQQARSHNDFATADRIRSSLASLDVSLNDKENGTEWQYMRQQGD